MSLKAATIRRYSVEQLVKHLLRNSDMFTRVNESLYMRRDFEECKSYVFYCLVTEYNKDVIVDLIETYT